MPARLSPAQVKHYRDEGYLLYKQPVLKPENFRGLKNHFEKSLAHWTNVRGKRPEDMDMPHMTDRALFQWLFADELLDVVESLIGPNIALWASHFICKPAGTGRRVPWHEDSYYWNVVLEPMEVVTLWLAIDRANVENGCMRLVPRTHGNGASAYTKVPDEKNSVFNIEIKAGEFDESTAVDCILEENECSLHHAKLIHGSHPNTSPYRRCGYTMRYISTASKFNPKLARQGHEIYLARGKDIAGNTYGDPDKLPPLWQEQVDSVIAQ